MSVTWQPGMTLKELESRVIVEALSHYRHNKTATAQALEISVRGLDGKLDRLQSENKAHEEARAMVRKQREEFMARSRGIPAGAQYDTSATPSASMPAPKLPTMPESKQVDKPVGGNKAEPDLAEFGL